MRCTKQWARVGVVGALALLATAVAWAPRGLAAATDDEVAAFLQQHWRLPIPLQGDPPSHFSPAEISLHPEDCGTCHPQQYQDWQGSIHSRSMGPGVYGQLLDMEQSDPLTYTICATCHTPLSEQLPVLEQDGGYRPNQAFNTRLQRAGLVCAACHVRQHQRLGPPRRADAPAPAAATALPHNGFTPHIAFQRSGFCKGCHQFGPDGFALNGKLIEDTYEEWRQSPYAREGIQCQTCHMPERRHLWRGIHDAEMVKQALTVTVTTSAPSYKPGDQVQAVITVTNSGAGHNLPTYVTPKIFVQSHLVDTRGTIIEGSAQQAVIGREVALDLSQESYDTRIPPKGSRSFTYTQALPAAGATLRVRLVVHPDHFYQRFFEAVLQDGGGGKGRAYLEEALRATQSSPFVVFERDVPLSPTPRP